MIEKKIALIVEDSKTIQLYLKSLLTPFGYEVLISTTLDDIKMLISKNQNIEMALLSLYLSDNLESIVDFNIKKQIPVILLSENEEISLREKFIKKNIVDYVKKTSLSDTHEITTLLKLLHKNNNETILVVDDSSLFRNLIKKLLKMHNFNVLEANDGQKALDVLEKNKHIDLVITDYEMPKLDGLGLIKSIRKTYSIQKLPIIVISSLSSQSTIVRCLKNGANDYLHKPFNHGEFYSRMYLTLSHKENLEQIAQQKQEYEELSHSLEKQVTQELIKNKKQASHMLQQSRLAQMGEMISMIAHQWRQPLASISAISGTLTLDIMMDEYKADFFEERLTSINELAQHLSSTIDDFRGFFKDNKEIEKITIKNLIDGSIQIIGPTLATKNITIKIDIKTDIELYTYTNEVKQVLLNIIKNAEDILVEKNIADASIWIDVDIEKESIILSIEDNAGGIDEEIMPKIFDPYFSTKKAKDGTGLGLYMSKTIIEEHCKGKLSVKNTKNGAKFIINFPLDKELLT